MSVNLKPSRYPSRASEDKALVKQVLDDGLFCTIAFLRDVIPHQIPTGYCHDDNYLYIHAALKSAFIDTIVGHQVSFSVTQMNAVVLSHSAFDSSFNYRSVVGFAIAEEITDPQAKLDFFKKFTDRYVPGRIADVGDPLPEQVAITRLLRFSLDQVGVKIRDQGVNVNDLAKYGKWCGLIPIDVRYTEPQVDEQVQEIALPDYIKKLIDR